MFGLQNDLKKAIQYTNKALSHAKKGGYTKEIVGSENALKSFENKLYHAKIRNKSQTNIPIKSMPACNLENEFTRLEDKIQEKRNTLECLNKEIDNSRQLLQQLQEEINKSKTKIQTLKEMESDLVNSIKTPEKIASTQTYTIVSLLIGLVCLCLMFCCLVIVLLLYWTKTLK